MYLLCIVEVFANVLNGVFPDDHNNLKVRHFLLHFNNISNTLNVLVLSRLYPENYAVGK